MVTALVALTWSSSVSCHLLTLELKLHENTGEPPALSTAECPEKHTRKCADESFLTGFSPDTYRDVQGHPCPALKATFLKLDLARLASCPAQSPDSSPTTNQGLTSQAQVGRVAALQQCKEKTPGELNPSDKEP